MTSARHAAPRPRIRSRRLSALFATISLICATFFSWGLVGSSAPAGAATTSDSVSRTETITRTHLVGGHDDQVDKRTVTITADGLSNLRDRQGVTISWKGAHPTGGVIFNPNSQFAAQQEYPVVVLQCRGVDSTSVAAAQRLSPRTCFTQTPEQRYQPPYRGLFPSYRLDRYATAADRRQNVGLPRTLPARCLQGDGAQHWVPFVAVDGTPYYGGYNGCAGLAPEQAVVGSALNPSSATFAATAQDGTGTARFIVQDAEDNASLGCSASVPCSLVVIPVMGISCDADATSLPEQDRPSDPAAAQAACGADGFYESGQPSSNQNASDPNVDVGVSGLLWWSQSNWRNRVSLPITFAPTAASCGITGGGAPGNIYGSQYMSQAAQQWAPTFCQEKNLFRLQYTQTSEVQAKNLLANGVTNGHYLGVQAAFQGAPPHTAFPNPIVQAPTALTGFAIGYVMDDGKQKAYTSLKLDARLLAKLLTMSYPAYPAVRDDWKSNAAWSKYHALGDNPLDLGVDPEFLALNPGMKQPYVNQLEASATLFAMSSDSDVMTALTSYIDADPDARAWLDGQADPWGMVVNPNYKGIALPVDSWPLLDTYYNPLGNECIGDNRSPILPLIAGPVADPSQITFNMQLGITNSQTNCVVSGATDTKDNRRLAALGPQQPGIRFLLGVVSLADARRYGIATAALETQKDSSAPVAFTDTTGRYFAGADDAGLRAAGDLLRPDDKLGTWPVPYNRMRDDPAGRAAYPGTMLMSTDVPTSGLYAADAEHYAKFLDYVAGPGQVAGSANGQLADGYLPLTKANGLGELAAYTEAAADAVRRQQGFLPKPSHPTVAATPTSAAPTTPTSSAHPSAAPSTTAGTSSPGGVRTSPGLQPGPTGGANLPVGGTTTPSRTTARTGESATPTRSDTALAPASPAASASLVAQPTRNTKPGWTALALPALAIAALLSGVLAAITSGVGRR